MDESGGLGDAGSSGGGNWLGDLWDIGKERLRGEVAARNAESFGGNARFAVDEYGNTYLRGQASRTTSLTGALGGLSPLVVIAAVALSAGLLYAALRD